VPASPSALLARLVEETGGGQPLRLGVELRVRERPEVADAAFDEALEVVRRRAAAHGDDTQDEEGDVTEAGLA
jgi:hypothetical protein